MEIDIARNKKVTYIFCCCFFRNFKYRSSNIDFPLFSYNTSEGDRPSELLASSYKNTQPLLTRKLRALVAAKI